MTVPPLISSSRFRQRRNVDLPLPEVKDNDDLTLVNIGRDIPQDFEVAEVLFQVLNVNFHIVLIDGHG